MGKPIDEDLIREFIVESREHLASIEEDFLEIEKNQDDPPAQLIDKVFRAIHSIKGAAGFLGLRNINSLSHVMETILQMIRSGETKPEGRFINALLEGVDKLRFLLDDVSDSDNCDIQKLHDKLGSLLAKSVSPKIKAEMNASVKLADYSGREINFEINEFILKRRPAHHEFLYVLKYDLDELNAREKLSPVALIKELAGTGEILESKLSGAADDFSEDMSVSHLSCEVLYSTVLDNDLIADAAHLPLSNIIRISLPIHEKQNNSSGAPPSETLQESRESAENGNPIQMVKKDPKAESIRINLNILDKLMTLAGELVLVRNQHLMAFGASTDSLTRGITQRLNLVTTELQETIMRTRMQPIGSIFSKLPRIVRDIAAKENKKIEIIITGNEVELDRTILDSLSDPLIHIIRNSCDHGIEMSEFRKQCGKKAIGSIHVKAFHEEGQINIEIEDDGAGINIGRVKEKAIKNGLRSREELEEMSEKDIMQLITAPGFSTAEKISEISGRGVGMDVVKTAISQLGGSLEISSRQGCGTSILLKMPLTLAIIPCLIVTVNDNRFAIPQGALEELVCLYNEDVKNKIESQDSQEIYRLRNSLLPIVRLGEVISRRKAFTKSDKHEITEKYRTAASSENMKHAELIFAVVKAGSQHFGLILDKVLGTEEIVVKPIHPSLKALKIYSGATIMGDGRCAMILDIDGLAAHAGLEHSGKREEPANEKITDQCKYTEEIQSLMLFKCGQQEQFAVPLPFIKRIEKIKAAEIEGAGEKEFINIDGVSTRIVRCDNVLGLSQYPQADDYFLLLPKHASKAFGILISSLIDIVHEHVNLNTDAYKTDAVMGTSIIKGHMTIFPDIYRLIEILEPGWFEKDKNKNIQLKRKVLLVEDALFFRQLVKGYLESDGYIVSTAENGKKGLECLKENTYDLLISDLEMPEMNGWDFIRAVRKNPEMQEIPAIALTALDSEKERLRALESGFNTFQTKIDREGLLKIVSGLLRQEEKASLS